MEGFIVLDYAAEWAEGIKQLAVWVSQGKIKPRNTVVKGGLEKTEQALADLFKGVNTGMFYVDCGGLYTNSVRRLTRLGTGKLVVEVKEPAA